LPWRSTTVAGDHWIACDFGIDKVVSAVSLVDLHLGDLVGTVKVQSSTDGVSWSDVTGGTLVQGATRTGVQTVWFDGITTRYLRVYFDHSSGSDYMQIGVVVAGEYFEPSYNIDTDSFQITREDLSSLTQGRSGAISKSRYGQFESFPMTFSNMPSGDTEDFRLMFQVMGIGSPFVLTVDDEDSLYTWYGYFTESLVTPSTDQPHEWHVSMSFREAM
jgi:hypothetical protein